ncbi:helix-turn-helix domain-containing protein [Methanosarcina lacustris]|uniref:helix-turn-helix domain-containing protein n=1 Tax=Methanosarcina lacustris TaxID=170861 RepID=UPI0009FD5F7A
MFRGNIYRIYPNKEQKALMEKHFDSCRFVYNQSCAGAPRRKQRGMFAPPLQIPLKKTITINTLV